MSTVRIVRPLQGLASAFVAYPIAERLEKREIVPKLAELRRHHRLPFPQRRRIALDRLANMLQFAGTEVPYYRDLFAARGFDPSRVAAEPAYLEELPPLTKDIIREQGDRMLSRPLAGQRHHACRTGGSTGQSAVVYYDQPAADYAAAVVLFARERVGKTKHRFEVHFASRFPEKFPLRDRLREHAKCFAMNRHNIFFDRLDDAGLEAIWGRLRGLRAYLVHSHPSTMYALACYVRERHRKGKAFEIFESSGELLEPYMRSAIGTSLQCRVIDRYGLAELGVVAYQLDARKPELVALESEVWPETLPAQDDPTASELVFTGLRNRLMPLIRYRSGDLGRLEEREDSILLHEMTGRIHDLVRMNRTVYPTHYIQDVLDRVGKIQEFQIDVRFATPVLRIVPELDANREEIRNRLRGWWKDGLDIEFVDRADLIRVGDRMKFRRVVRV